MGVCCLVVKSFDGLHLRVYNISCVCLIEARVRFGVLLYYGVLFAIPLCVGLNM